MYIRIDKYMFGIFSISLPSLFIINLFEHFRYLSKMLNLQLVNIIQLAQKCW